MGVLRFWVPRTRAKCENDTFWRKKRTFFRVWRAHSCSMLNYRSLSRSLFFSNPPPISPLAGRRQCVSRARAARRLFTLMDGSRSETAVGTNELNLYIAPKGRGPLITITKHASQPLGGMNQMQYNAGEEHFHGTVCASNLPRPTEDHDKHDARAVSCTWQDNHREIIVNLGIDMPKCRDDQIMTRMQRQWANGNQPLFNSVCSRRTTPEL
jgi:hypothetical protein